MVLITLFTTVYPTDFVQATIAPSVSSTLAPASTIAISSSATLRSNVPASTVSISSEIFSSQTLLPASSATGIPPAPKQMFNETFAYISLAALIVLTLLYIGIILYLVYLRFRGECLHCHDLQQQLRKWKSGELKNIMPFMVRERDALNKAASTRNASSDVDIEMGFVGREMSRAATPNKPGNSKKPTHLQKAMAMLSRRGRSPTRTPDPSSEDGVDRFFTVDPDASIGNPETSHRTMPVFPQATYNAGNLYGARYSAYPASSVYSQAIDFGRIHANRSRVSSDVWTPGIANMRGHLREESDEPNPYTTDAPTEHAPYNSDQKQRNIATALATLESREYKDAESILKRGSGTDYEIRRALSIVNLADQTLNIARHPSAYTEVNLSRDQPLEVEVPTRPESYQVLDWRKKGLRPPELEEVQEDFSPYLEQELGNKQKST